MLRHSLTILVWTHDYEKVLKHGLKDIRQKTEVASITQPVAVKTNKMSMK